jgi:hypothetical protein
MAFWERNTSAKSIIEFLRAMDISGTNFDEQRVDATVFRDSHPIAIQAASSSDALLI